MDEKKIASLMAHLGCTREEAISVIEDDARIDRGEKLFEPTAEQKKASKAMTITTNRTSKVAKKPRVKEVNPDKTALITAITEAVSALGAEQLVVANPEREFAFNFGGVKYKIVLSAPRT